MFRIQPEQSHNYRAKGTAVLFLLTALLLFCICLSFCIGRYPVPVKELFGILCHKFSGLFGGFSEPFWTPQMEAAVWNIRLPRILTSVMVGMCLSAAGAAFQGIFRNPMAAPDVLGASAGAGFGAALAILFGFSKIFVTLSAFTVSLLTVFLVLLISRYAKGERLLGLILAGIIVSSLFQAGTSFIKLAADPNNKLPMITYWLMGSFSGANWSGLLLILPLMLLGLLPLNLLRWRINVLTMGDDEALAMGVDAKKVRLAVILSATLITAASVSVSGMIGWVGLVIPHMMRRIAGNDYRILMPASMLGGGIFLLVTDNISRNISSSGIPIGILTAFIGAPFFLLLITGKGGSHED